VLRGGGGCVASRGAGRSAHAGLTLHIRAQQGGDDLAHNRRLPRPQHRNLTTRRSGNERGVPRSALAWLSTKSLKNLRNTMVTSGALR
jgi:hypothetical protein